MKANELDEVMTVRAIADEMGIDETGVRVLARRAVKPLPLRILIGKKRGAFAFRSEFIGWMRAASCPYAERGCYVDEQDA